MTIGKASFNEWLETDGLGGYASGTATGARTRRQHALLASAAPRPDADRAILVNGFDAYVTTEAGRFALTSHVFTPDVVHPDGATRIAGFAIDPWPRWTYRLEDGAEIEHEVLMPRGVPAAAIAWKLKGKRKNVRLSVRPLLSGRGRHELHRENDRFRFAPEARGGRLIWRPYPGMPAIVSIAGGDFEAVPEWYRNFFYREDYFAGLDAVEDLASPGWLHFDLSKGEAAWILACGEEAAEALPSGDAASILKSLRTSERRRRSRLATPLRRAADAYVAAPGGAASIVAGYPYHGATARDTFVALRGLAIATGRLDDARDVLLSWAGRLTDGVFPGAPGEAEGASSDAGLWFVIAAAEYLDACTARRRAIPPAERERLMGAIEAILDAYARGAWPGVRLDRDGLLSAGDAGRPASWMDARVAGRAVTPRSGKPVELQALWLNALALAGSFSDRWAPRVERGLDAFRERFWNEEGGCLHDVVDVDGVAGTVDSTLRPNQILAAGGLPLTLLDPEQARRVVTVMEGRLRTPLGLRSLDPTEPGYCGRAEGNALEREAARHQGSAWPWLAGPFVEAWVKSRNRTPAAKEEARRRFLEPLLAHLGEAGLGHVSEIADGDAPHAPRGGPFHAVSVGEALRIEEAILAKEPAKAQPRRTAPRTAASATVGAAGGHRARA